MLRALTQADAIVTLGDDFCCTQILSFKLDEQARYLELKAADTTSGPMPAASASVQELDDEEEPAAD